KPKVKKNKSSDGDEPTETKPKGRGRTKTDTTTTNGNTKQTAAAAPAPVEIDYDRIINGVTDNIAEYVGNHIDAATIASVNRDQIAEHVTAAIDTALQPYLAILEPLLEFTQTCAKLKSKDEEKANRNKAAVNSLVEPMKKKEDEEEDDLFGDGTTKTDAAKAAEAAEAAEAAKHEQIETTKAAADDNTQELTPVAESDEEVKVKVEDVETPRKKGAAEPKPKPKIKEKTLPPKINGKRKQSVEDNPGELHGNTLVSKGEGNENDSTSSPGKRQKTEAEPEID
ncbi:hypothetical protein E8E11_010460, partial [Didymella keratinophila]